MADTLGSAWPEEKNELFLRSIVGTCWLQSLENILNLNEQD